ncbi:uncharacterized protein LOC130810219 [Amaranthus tricolor]|uniref:uncharacterized protein LOC130810219 n=1 Tax=Amaranthus tricolor TaxID=29722 RepID=UPI002586633C|nr:uncharacterized protein LOC130810219 [Amaranthus tricolor]
MPERSTTEAIHLLRRLIEKCRERKKDVHLVFIDLEKAYDSIPRNIVWDSLKNKGSALSPFIFTVIMEEISKSIWETIPWCMLFTDDIVNWKSGGKGLRISHTKIEYLRCNFSGTESIGEPEVTTAGEVVACTSKFKYLESVIQSNGEIEEDVTKRIQAG